MKHIAEKMKSNGGQSNRSISPFISSSIINAMQCLLLLLLALLLLLLLLVFDFVFIGSVALLGGKGNKREGF